MTVVSVMYTAPLATAMKVRREYEVRVGGYGTSVGGYGSSGRYWTSVGGYGN